MAKCHWLIIPLILTGCGKPVVPDPTAIPAPTPKTSTPKQETIDYSKRGPADLKLEQKQANAEGIPLTEAELTPPVSPAENAAPLYVEAIARLRALGPSSSIRDGLNLSAVSNPTEAATAEKCLQAAKPILALLAQAARRPACQFSKAAIAASNAQDVAFEKAFADATENRPDPRMDSVLAAVDIHIPADMKALVNLVVLDVRLTAYRSRPVDALHKLAIYAPIGQHVQRRPETIAAITGASIGLKISKEISEILAQHGREPNVAEAAAKALAALGPDPDLVRLAEGESLRMQLRVFPTFTPAKGEKPRKQQYNETDDERVSRLTYRAGMIEEWRAVELDQTRKLVNIYKAAGDNWTKLASEADSARESYSTPSDDAHVFFHLSLLPGKYIETFARERSRRRVLSQAAAVFTVWVKTGKLPDALPLTGLAAKDSLSSNNLHYSHTANGFTVYGVGPGGIDHGGKLRAPSNESKTYDIVFTYPAPVH